MCIRDSYKNTYDDIFKIFHQKDYTTSYMHGNYGYFWNRTNVYNNMEVDHVEDVYKRQV